MLDTSVNVGGVTVAPEGRKLLRIEKRNAETPIESKPRWIRNQVKTGPEYEDMKQKVKGAGLHTVCQEAGCPNIFECWEDREATFLIGGDTCTRRCDFCDIATGKPGPLDLDEPRRVAESVREMGLRYATVTGVARDDLKDGAAQLYGDTVRLIHGISAGSFARVVSKTCLNCDERPGALLAPASPRPRRKRDFLGSFEPEDVAMPIRIRRSACARPTTPPPGGPGTMPLRRGAGGSPAGPGRAWP